MSQRPLTTISTKSIPTYQIPSALAAALGSLDVNLEDELIRYRRHCAGEPPPPPRGLERDRPHPPLDLISVTAPITAKTSPPLPKLTRESHEAIASDKEKPTAEKLVETPQLETPSTALSPKQVSLEQVTDSAIAKANPEKASLVLLAQQSKTANLANSTTEPKDPEDYLKSSEELLKSLEDDDETSGDRHWSQSLLTPLGIGLMLLVVTGCVAVGLLLANPSMVRHLFPNGSFNAQTPATDKNPTPPSPTAGIPQTPNLADREFTPITLDTLSTLETNPSPIPVPLQPTPKSEFQPSDPSTSQEQPTENQYFYVVTPYDLATLEQVRQIIPDAYIRYDLPQGTQIQLGAFQEEYRANALAEELQSQGIAAAVYQPQAGNR